MNLAALSSLNKGNHLLPALWPQAYVAECDIPQDFLNAESYCDVGWDHRPVRVVADTGLFAAFGLLEY